MSDTQTSERTSGRIPSTCEKYVVRTTELFRWYGRERTLLKVAPLTSPVRTSGTQITSPSRRKLFRQRKVLQGSLASLFNSLLYLRVFPEGDHNFQSELFSIHVMRILVTSSLTIYFQLVQSLKKKAFHVVGAGSLFF